MSRPHPYAVLSLILGVTVAPPCFCQPAVFEIQGAAFRRATENGRDYALGMQANHRYDYGTVASNAPGYEQYLAFGHQPRISWAARTGPDDSIESATLDFHSAPPGASCPWSNAPGASWLPRNCEPLLVWDPPIIPNIFANTQECRGADAAIGTVAGGFTIPFRGKVDDLFLWWAAGGEDGEPFCSAMDIPEVITAYLTVSAPQPCEPYVFIHDGWVLSERADFTITIFPTEPPHADLDRDGAAGVPDVFTFLAEWFAGRAAGDWDADGGCTVPDIFAFLSEWFGDFR
jgi:hypothetical protein